MKADRILTMNEFLDECSGSFHRIAPPSLEACHIPVSATEAKRSNGENSAKAGCTCDRWGHPYFNRNESSLRKREEIAA